MRDSYNLDLLAQVGAQAALSDQDYLKKTVALVIKERNYLTESLKTLGFKVEPSQTNFIFVTPPAGIKAVAMQVALENSGFFVRYFADPDLAHGLRITIGLHSEMEQLISAIKQILEDGE